MDQTAGFLIPLAAIVILLWLLWSDSIRQRAMPRVWFFFRASLYLVVGAVMAYNGWRYGSAFTTMNWVLIGVAIAVAILGAAYFFRRGQGLGARG
ncbi:MAG: hypothetical protein ABR524_09950 [Thermoanaerobaculia bacterium]